jgi:hypothetical protein
MIDRREVRDRHDEWCAGPHRRKRVQKVHEIQVAELALDDRTTAEAPRELDTPPRPR